MKVSELFEEDGVVPDRDQEKLKAAVAAIVKDCKPFLKDFGGHLLFRGSRSQNHGATKLFSKRGVRSARRPMNTAEHIHQKMDSWFYKKFNIKARSATMFASGDFREARGYGIVYCVFPIGDFRFIWSPKVTDLFIELRDDDESDVEGFLERAQYQDTDLQAAIVSKHEIMIDCKEYYLLLANSPEDREEVLRMLQDEIA